jgi:hypothetical protein
VLHWKEKGRNALPFQRFLPAVVPPCDHRSIAFTFMRLI